MANYVTLAGTFEGKRFNSPNDVVQKSNGDFYFTDPPYGLEEGSEDPAKELEFQGVFLKGGSQGHELISLLCNNRTPDCFISCSALLPSLESKFTALTASVITVVSNPRAAASNAVNFTQ